MDGFASGEGGMSRLKYWVYVLKSEKDGRLYVGSTNDILDRLKRHARGECLYTKGHRPWKIVQQEICRSKSEAVRREKYLKTGVGRQELEKFR